MIHILTPENLKNENGTTVRLKILNQTLNKIGKSILIGQNKRKDNRPNNNTLNNIRTLYNMIKKIKKDKPEIILTQSYRLFPIINFLFPKQKIIFEAQGLIFEESKMLGKNKIIQAYNKILQKYVLINANYVISLSRLIEKEVKKHNDNQKMIPVYFKNKFIKYSPKKNSKNKIKIGLIGPFDIAHNKTSIDFLKKNITNIKDKIEIFLIGKPKIDIHPRVHSLGYCKNYYKTLKEMDIILIPSKISTTGPLNKILEPLAIGTPVICSEEAFKGMPYLEKNVDITVKKNEELLTFLNKLENNKLEKTAINANRKIKEKFSEKSVIKKLKIILEEIND